MTDLRAWLDAFLFTQCVEVPIYAWRLEGRRHRFLAAFGASTITHPLLWFVLPRFIDVARSYALYAVVGEALVVLVEAAYLRALRVRRALLWSLVANGASCGLGLATRALLGWH